MFWMWNTSKKKRIKKLRVKRKKNINFMWKKKKKLLCEKWDKKSSSECKFFIMSHFFKKQFFLSLHSFLTVKCRKKKNFHNIKNKIRFLMFFHFSLLTKLITMKSLPGISKGGCAKKAHTQWSDDKGYGLCGKINFWLNFRNSSWTL